MTAQPNLAEIKLLLLDVDCVLTDGTVAFNSDGAEGAVREVIEYILKNTGRWQ